MLCIVYSIWVWRFFSLPSFFNVCCCCCFYSDDVLRNLFERLERTQFTYWQRLCDDGDKDNKSKKENRWYEVIINLVSVQHFEKKNCCKWSHAMKIEIGKKFFDRQPIEEMKLTFPWIYRIPFIDTANEIKTN